MNKQNDEIDLLELSRQMLVGFYYYIKRRAILIIVFAIVGVAVGVGVHLKNRTVYKSSLIGKAEFIKPEIINDLVNSLDALVKSDKPRLQNILGINNIDIENINKIEADTVKTFYKKILSDKKYIDVVDFTNIEIKITYKKSLELDSLEHKIVNFLNTNKYIAQQLEIKEKCFKNSLSNLNKEIKKLDSLQNNILAASLIKDNASLGQLMVMKDNEKEFFHEDVINLQNLRNKNLAKIETLTSLNVIKPFDKARTKEKTIIENIGFFFGIFFGIGFLVSIILEMRRKALKFVKKE